MIYDLVELLNPNASLTELILLSNICVYIGWSVTFLGFLSTIVVTLDEKRFFYEGFQYMLLGLLFIMMVETNSTVSLARFFYYNSILISIP